MRHDVLEALRKLQPNLSCTKKNLQQVVTLLLQRFAEEPNWRLREEDQEGYVTTMALRLASVCRSVAAAERRHPRCCWVRALPCNVSSAAAPARASSSEDF